jgi:hypothetical protein
LYSHAEASETRTDDNNFAVGHVCGRECEQ